MLTKKAPLELTTLNRPGIPGGSLPLKEDESYECIYGFEATPRRYSPEVKERAVRLVMQLRAETGEKHGTVKRVAEQLDIGVESLRSWVKQHEIDAGDRAGVTERRSGPDQRP